MIWTEIVADVADGVLDAFGEPITISGVAQTGIFDPRGGVPALAEVQAPFGPGTVDPIIRPLLIVSVDLEDEIALGVLVEARGVEYLIIRHEPDGLGTIRVELEAVQA